MLQFFNCKSVSLQRRQSVELAEKHLEKGAAGRVRVGFYNEEKKWESRVF